MQLRGLAARLTCSPAGSIEGFRARETSVAVSTCGCVDSRSLRTSMGCEGDCAKLIVTTESCRAESFARGFAGAEHWRRSRIRTARFAADTLVGTTTANDGETGGVAARRTASPTGPAE